MKSKIFRINDRIIYNEIDTLIELLKHGDSESINSICGYHATKEFIPGSLSNGLYSANVKILKNVARCIFYSYNEKENSIINQTIDDFEIQCKGQLHYAVNKRIYDRCYSYLLLGSENLMNIADQLKNKIAGKSFRNILYRTGKSVIIHFNIPIEKLSEIENQEITEMLGEIVKYKNKGISLEYSFVHWNDIRKENILKIEEKNEVINESNIPIF